LVGGHAGTDDVDAVQRGLGGDLGMAAGPGNAGVGDLQVEVLGDLEAAQHLAHPHADLGGTGQLACLDQAGDLVELGLSGGQQLGALSGALGGQGGLRQAIGNLRPSSFSTEAETRPFLFPLDGGR
jgi:hypothetical protein